MLFGLRNAPEDISLGSSNEAQITSAYDDVAGMYHTLWQDWYLPAALPCLEGLFFSQVAPGSKVLDLCCGSGHVTKELIARGYEVTGVDSSAALIEIARAELPGADLRVQDARSLKLANCYDAALSTFDSLNHILSIEELKDVFSQIYGRLRDGGLFVFDMNLEEAYSMDLRQWHVTVREESVGLVRGTYDFDTKKAITELIWFRREGSGENCWRQGTGKVEQRCYESSAVSRALRDAGFGHILLTKATDAGMSQDLGFGRVFFSVTR